MLMKELIRNLLEFIRFKICIFVSAIGMSGFLIFNPLDMRLILVALTSFFGSAGAYSFNNIKDVKEDLINRKKINSFTLSVKGLIIVFVCLSIGFVSSLFLSLQSIFFYLFGSATSITYSFFKIKKYFLIKNLYTGFSATLMFLIGANNISIEVLRHYFLISFFVFIVSIISDLRDYKGDKISSIKTLPVLLGYNKTRKIVSILLCMFLFLIINSHFIILLPFSLIIVFFVYKNKTRIAHSIGGFALIFLTIFLIIGDV
jgi:4-hydroxybenzoate polyprenyltransferase